MKNKFLKFKIIIIIIFIALIGFAIIKSAEYVSDNSNNVENVSNEVNNNVINNNEVEKESEKIITEVNIVTDINSLTNLKIEDVAKNTLNEYLEKIASYEKSSIGPMPDLLIELELATEEELNLLCKNSSSTSDYIKSNVKYERFKNALLQYVTEEYFVKYFSQYRNIDEYVAFCDCAASVVWTSVEKAELLSRVGNTFNFKMTLKDLEVYEHYLNEDGDIKEDDCYFDMNVAFDYVNERLVLSKYSTEIILEGVYFLDNTDVSYEFYKDGTVEYSTNMSVYKGTYLTCGENDLRITWEEETTWDIITGEESVSKTDGTEEVTVINNTKIRVESEHDGEKVLNEFIKK